MNLIQQPWKSQIEFIRERPYTEDELKIFLKAKPFTQNLIKEKQSEFIIVGQFIKNEIGKVKQEILYRGSFYEPIIKDVEINQTKKVSLPDNKISEFQKYLLSWPEMTDEEFNYIQEKRNHFNEWK